MIHRPSRRDIVKATAKVAAIGALGAGRPAIVRAQAPARPAAGTFSHVDAMLRAATSAGEMPGVVTLAATMASSMRACSAGAAFPKGRR
jgi:hypothetical protein